jgi:hypothetical protein
MSRLSNYDIINLWLSPNAPSVKDVTANNLRVHNDEIYSYQLLIAKKFKSRGTITALIRDPNGLTQTTRRHIKTVAVAAQASFDVADVFTVPHIDPYSKGNADFFTEFVNSYREKVLNNSHSDLNYRYRTRVAAISHYYEALYDLYEYGLFAHTYDETRLQEPYVETIPLLDMLEKIGDYKFLGRLALEGDHEILHTKEQAYKELTGSNG